MKSRNMKYLVLPSLLALSVSSVIAAEQDANEKGAENNDGGINTITVTAQKREQSIQDVPITVSALTGDSLEKRGLDGIKDYSNFVSGMVFSGTAFVGERSGPDITIRGVANSRLFDMETSIATATTGFVYGQMPAYSFDPRLMDIDRVEVLKGPQGTLYGAASMGGTVKVMPSAPDASEFIGKISGGLGYTNDGDQNNEFSGMVNIPIIEGVLAARVSGFSFSDSGYIDARMVTGNPSEQRGGSALASGVDPGSAPINSNDLLIYNIDEPNRTVIENINDVQTVGGQFAVKYTPSDEFDATFSYFFQSKDEGSLPNYEPSLSSEINERTTELFILQPSSTDYSIGQLELRYDLGFAELHSVTGSLNRKFTNATDFSAIVYGSLGGDGTVSVPGTAPVNFMADIDVFSQEIRLDGSADILAGLNWSLGFFYQKEDRLATGSVPVSSSWMASGELLPPSGTRWVWGGEYTSEYTNNSFFSDVSLSLTDDLILSVGARKANQDLSSRRIDFGNVFSGASTPDGYTDSSTAFDEAQTTPRVALSWKATDDVMIYTSAAEGFRMGGANPVGNLSTPGCQNALNVLGITDAGAFESDSVRNYELGAKTQFADNKILLNVSAFQVDWSDLQVSTSLSAFDDTCGSSIVANVGEAQIKGVEVELRALLSDNWQIGVVAESNDHKLTEGNPGVPGAQPGDPLKNIPDFSISVGLQYDFTAIDNIDGYARLDYVHTGERSFSDIAAGPSDAFNLNAFDLLNLRLGLFYEDLEFVVYVDNLTDEVTQLGVTNLPGGPGIYVDGSGSQRFVGTGRPLTAGIKITKHF